MQSIETLSERVRQHGGKVTAQRLLIWQALLGDTSHPTAEELHARLRQEAPTLSLTTVYNIVNELVGWGEIRRFDTGDGSIHFDPDMAPHAELICMRCHSVTDLPTTGVGGVLQPPALPTDIGDFRVITRAEQYYGICPDCQREPAGEA